MIVVGYNGFARSSELFGSLYGRKGRDRNRVLGHDAAASVFVDGRLVAAVEEERLSRAKRTSDFPRHAIAWCLRRAGLKPDDVDIFAFPWRFDVPVMRRLLTGLCESTPTVADLFSQVERFKLLYDQMLAPEQIRSELSERLGVNVAGNRMILVPHHLAHLMCGYYFAQERDAAFLVSDGRAEHLSAIAGEIKGGTVRVFEDMEVGIANSLSQLYSKVTRYLGFMPNNDEYKVMGLSAYDESRPLERNPLFDTGAVTLLEGGRYTIAVDNVLADDCGYYALFDEWFGLDGPPTSMGARARVASCVQDAVEKITAHQLHELEARTGNRRLIFEGGLALNCVNNGRIAREHAFTDVHVSFCASDPGVAIGAAYYHFFASESATHRTNVTPFLGPSYGPDDALRALDLWGGSLTHRRLEVDELLDAVVELLRTPAVIGWFQGPTEYGPRALCGRSILANPSLPGMKDLLNERIKRREGFRPFGPVIHEERASSVFEMGTVRASPYMTFTYPVREGYHQALRGAIHIDGTSRIQTVNDAQNPLIAQLLKRFEARTGVPALINTSFNVAGEPIVCSPEDALACFVAAGMDHLVLGNLLISMPSHPKVDGRNGTSAVQRRSQGMASS